MTALQRSRASTYIKRNAYEWQIGYEEESVVDLLNVTGAEMSAIHRCLDRLETKFELIVMDGSYFKPYLKNGKENIKHVCIPKADDTFLSVSCASILAKHERDEYVSWMCTMFPELNERYDISSNMGYPRPQHVEGIKRFGITQWHRKTFGPCKTASYNPICHVLI